MSRREPPVVCFVVPDGFPALTGRVDLASFGGAEMQQAVLAREMARRGRSVSFVSWDYGQSDGAVVDGVRVFKGCGPRQGWPGLRFIHPRWTGLCAAMARADADVYYQRGAGSETGQAALWCRRHHRRFVFASASDTNCVAALPDLPSRRERLLFRHGLRLADAVVAQTRTQAQMLQRAFGVSATVVRSCAVDPWAGGGSNRDSDSKTYADPPSLLWVGRLSPKKRFEWVLDLATAHPEWSFDVVGDSREGDYARGLADRAAGLPNLTLHGRVPPDRIGRYYERASVLLCTSPQEGFPNTFLEAWGRAIPVASTVDPDGVVAGNHAGVVGRSLGELGEAIGRLLADDVFRRECGQRGRRLFLAEFSVAAAVDAYHRLFDELTAVSAPALSAVTR